MPTNQPIDPEELKILRNIRDTVYARAYQAGLRKGRREGWEVPVGKSVWEQYGKDWGYTK